MAGINPAITDVLPLDCSFRAHPLGLSRRQNRELDVVLRQHLERFGVDRSFRQPHALRLASEARFKITNPPLYLRYFVAVIGQGQDHVVVTLRHRRSVTREASRADFVSFENRFVDLRSF